MLLDKFWKPKICRHNQQSSSWSKWESEVSSWHTEKNTATRHSWAEKEITLPILMKSFWKVILRAPNIRRILSSSRGEPWRWPESWRTCLWCKAESWSCSGEEKTLGRTYSSLSVPELGLWERWRGASYKDM